MNEKKAREIVAERSGGVCERCGKRRADTMHHRKNRSQGGAWTPANLLHLCGDGTAGCHGVITNTRSEFYIAGWCVRRDSDPTETAVMRRWEWVLLDDDGCVTALPDPFEEVA